MGVNLCFLFSNCLIWIIFVVEGMIDVLYGKIMY